ncbi:PIN domain-containing protein [Candidatus Roizmanbacteria bacterium]|nr:PIN domain-containing protein [Candidatus Roizmanbacteria bacterium]
MRYFVDSNIFLRVLAKDNKEQFNSCIVFLKTLKENKIDAYTSTIVLAEIVFTLKSFYHFEKAEVISAFKSIINLRGLKITDIYNYLKAEDLYSNYPIRFIDALIASDDQILDKKVTIVSYDKDFDKLPVLRKEPTDI